MIDSFNFTNVGGRDENQDSLTVMSDRNRNLFIVADGLGGHQHGSQASGCVVSALSDCWRAARVWNRDALFSSFRQANDALLALQNQLRTTAKSTAALLSIEGNRASCANTGDSRIYFLRNSGIRMITEDHSVAFKKYKSGEINKDQIAADEDQSSLLRVMGNDTRWEPEAYEVDGLRPGDSFLLCTDGFWEYISDEEMLLDRLSADTARRWAQLMLLRVIERVPANHDNLSLITVILR
ncbi:MAG: protein phosphatase 2C domain-containing protein [Oscillospiraceae bacterium]|nr:protein phosphatase 2C domain-containing protein [Oscillospiraceae bacterium]